MTSTISLHFEKHKYGSTGLKKHVERLPGQQHSNKNIKNHLTKDNIFLAGNRDLSYQNRINNIIKYQLNGKKTRRDAVKLVTTTVQLGGDAKNKDKSDQISALKSAFELLKEDIGEKNIVSAVIHVDETTPHLHFDFVPIINDKLSAKALLGDKEQMKKRQDKFLDDMKDKHPEFDFARKENQQFNGLEQELFEKMTEQVRLKEQLLDDKIINFASEVKIRRSELNERELGVQTREKELEQRETSLNASKDKLKNQIDKFNEYQRNAVQKNKDKETQLNQRSEDLVKTEAKQDKKELMLQQREIELNQYQTRLKDKEKEQEEKEKEIDFKNSFLKSKQLQQQKAHDEREDELARRQQELTTQENTIKSTFDAFKTLINEQKLKLSTVEEYEKEVDKLTDSFNFGEDDFTKVVTDLTKNNERGNSIER